MGYNGTKVASITPNFDISTQVNKRRLENCCSNKQLNYLRPLKKRHLYVQSLLPSVQSSQKVVNSDEGPDLTNLNWLQDSNLLNKIYSDTLNAEKCSIKNDQAGEITTLGVKPKSKNVNPKPPFSYSALIFMAIESSPNKSLMVRDIYKWIINNFPYFEKAPSGWKNTIRHTLSLRKCFKKTEKCFNGKNFDHLTDTEYDSGDIKGSYWHVDNEYRPGLLNMLERADVNIASLTRNANHVGSKQLENNFWSPHKQWPRNVSILSYHGMHGKPNNGNLSKSSNRLPNGSVKFHFSIDNVSSNIGLQSQGIKKIRNAVSVISVNKAPKVYAPMPTIMSHKLHNVTCNGIKPFKSFIISNEATKISSNNQLKTFDNCKKMEQTIKPNVPTMKQMENRFQLLKPNVKIEKSMDQDQDNAVHLWNSNQMWRESKVKTEDGDNELILDGAQALLNFATGAFQLNRLIGQQD